MASYDFALSGRYGRRSGLFLRKSSIPVLLRRRAPTESRINQAVWAEQEIEGLVADLLDAFRMLSDYRTLSERMKRKEEESANGNGAPAIKNGSLVGGMDQEPSPQDPGPIPQPEVDPPADLLAAPDEAVDLQSTQSTFIPPSEGGEETKIESLEEVPPVKEPGIPESTEQADVPVEPEESHIDPIPVETTGEEEEALQAELAEAGLMGEENPVIEEPPPSLFTIRVVPGSELLAEPIRLILAYLSLPYTSETANPEDSPVSLINPDGTEVGTSAAEAVKWLGELYEIAGEDEVVSGRAQVLLMAWSYCLNAIYEARDEFESRWPSLKSEEVAALIDQCANLAQGEAAPIWLSGNSLTYADLVSFQLIRNMAERDPSLMEAEATELLERLNKFAHLPSLLAYFEEAPNLVPPIV